jgi:hypothetical protein
MLHPVVLRHGMKVGSSEVLEMLQEENSEGGGVLGMHAVFVSAAAGCVAGGS